MAEARDTRKRSIGEITWYDQGNFSTCSLVSAINVVSSSEVSQRLLRNSHYSNGAPVIQERSPEGLITPFIAELEGEGRTRYKRRLSEIPIADLEDEGLQPTTALERVLKAHGVRYRIETTNSKYIVPHDDFQVTESLQEALKSQIATACIEKGGENCFDHLVAQSIEDNAKFPIASVVAIETTVKPLSNETFSSSIPQTHVQRVKMVSGNTYTFTYQLIGAIATVNVVEGEMADKHSLHALGCVANNRSFFVINSWDTPEENVFYHEWHRRPIYKETESNGTLQTMPDQSPILPIYVIYSMSFTPKDPQKASKHHTFNNLWPSPPQRGGNKSTISPLFLWSISLDKKHLFLSACTPTHIRAKKIEPIK